MNLWLNLNINDEPMNNANYINNKDLSLSDEDLQIIKNVLAVLTQDLAVSDKH